MRYLSHSFTHSTHICRMPCKHEAQYMYKTEKGTDLPTLRPLEFTVTTFLPSTPEVSTELSEHAAYISLPEVIL